MADIYTSPSQAIVSRELTRLAPGAITQKAGFTYIDGTMIASVISPVLARAIAVGRLIRYGIGTTEDFTKAIDVNKVHSVTVQLQNSFDVTTRTIGEGGTDGNNGLINFAGQMIPSTRPFYVPLTQLNDRALFFPALQLKAADFDVVANSLANYADMASLSMDTYHIATGVAYAAYRAVKEAAEKNLATIEDASNVIKIASANAYNENYMIQRFNALNAAMAEGDPENSLMIFTGPREIVARPLFIGWMKTPKTGFISNYNDIGQKLLLEPNFDPDLKLSTAYGSQYRGEISGYRFYEANTQVFTYVEKWLGLATGSLNKIHGIVFSPQAYASGGAFTQEINIVQNTTYNGLTAFPFHKFGGAAYRKMFIIVEDDFTFPAVLTGTKTSPIATPKPVVAPQSFDVKTVTTIENSLSNGHSVDVQDPYPANQPVEYSISGKVVNGTNTAIADVAIKATNEFGEEFTTTTAADGTYTVENVTGTVNVVPTKAGSTFLPASQKVSYDGDITGVDFVGFAA